MSDLSTLEPTLDSTREAVRRARRAPRRRRLGVVTGLGALVVAAFAVSTLLGLDYTYTVPDFVRILLGADIPVASYLMMDVKLPRAVLAVLVGLCFGAGGALFQITLRNPLASPDIVGVTMGASTFAVFGVIILGWSSTPVAALAVLGAVAVALVVRAVGGRAGGQRIVLVGVVMAAALASVIHYLMSRASLYDVQLALQWLAGSLHNASWDRVRMVALALLVLTPIVVVLLGGLRASQLGDDLATGLGMRRATPDLLLGIGVLLVAVAVAASGPIAFLSFMSGPIARALNGGRPTILGAALTGAALVLVGDYVGDYLIGDIHLPVGIITGAAGAPFLLWLLSRGAAGKASS